MVQKHVAVCDQCGREACLRPVASGGLVVGWDQPMGWLMVWSVVDASVSAGLGVRSICSWECVARYAIDKRAEEDRDGCASPGSTDP
jgi:hypothetical protein